MVKKGNKTDLIYFVVFVPALVAFAVVCLILLNKVAKKNSRVCSYLGKIWLEGSPADPSVRQGCFTYEELYSVE
jgi:hypothetical protein